MRIFKNIFALAIFLVFLLPISCNKELQNIENRLEDLSSKVSSLENDIKALNDEAIALSALLNDKILILSIKSDKTSYSIELSDGTTITIVNGLSEAANSPLIGVDKNGKWIVSFDNGETFDYLDDTSATTTAGATPKMRVNAEGLWEYSMNDGESWRLMVDRNGKPMSAVDGETMTKPKRFISDVIIDEDNGKVSFVLIDGRVLDIPMVRSFYFDIIGFEDKAAIYLGEQKRYSVDFNELADMALIAPEGWSAVFDGSELIFKAPSKGVAGTYNFRLIAVSEQGYIKNIVLTFTLNPVKIDAGYIKEWNDFVKKNEDNVLLDFSYAGYYNGASAPPDVYKLDGYKIFNVVDYGAVPNDGKSDRAAFIAALEAALRVKSEVDANGDIVFAHKESAKSIVYFPEGEFILHTSEDDVDGKSQSIIIRAGNFILKGAGRDKTFIVMQDPMNPVDPQQLYSSADMIQIKHMSSFTSSELAEVTEDAHSGSLEVTVSNPQAITKGSWVCLHVKNSDPDFVAAEVYPYEAGADWAIATEGVEVIQYQQVKSVEGNSVSFYQPILHDIDASRGWKIMNYPHYKNVGVEDLTFRGNAKSDFVHHGSWEYDGAYKPISLNRVVNGWIRRVGFESVSECCSIINSANVSAYDITMSGNRGHAAVRSQASTRVLIAKTIDTSTNGAGNFHGVGVSLQSIGTVLWRNQWGDDSCFESHSAQPRATLIDCCTGGWMRGHQGGDANLAPNHLDGLVIWNFKATGAGSEGAGDYADFTWWHSTWWKFLPPVVVGFQSPIPVEFNAEQTKVNTSYGVQVDPESLYEAQLRKRLGYVPTWINDLK